MILFTLVLIGGRYLVEWSLSRLNERHVRLHADAVPETLRPVFDDATYRKSVNYTLARSAFGKLVDTFSAILLIVVLFSGILPWAFREWTEQMGASSWSMASFLLVTGIALGLPHLPFEWYAQFKLEERFGFNTTTRKTWVADRVKGVLLAVVLILPLLTLVFYVIERTGANWWAWAFLIVVGFQLLLMLIAPAFIMPLFNKFTPLADSSLRQRLFALAQRTGFPTRSIDVMDGSKRSRHSNAFFTGFGRFRKIVLFDTLVEQLSERELEAVLAHEIGHYKKRHIWKMISVSALGMLVAFAALAWLSKQDWFFDAFGFVHETGFAPAAIAPAMLLFALLAGTVSFWLTPLINILSRHFEYQADAFARHVMQDAESLVAALRKLSEKNLSNLTPHPLYSAFYYSHPTLMERENALKARAMA